MHKVHPIPKTGDLTNLANYRPISLLSTPSKVLERVVYDKIIDFIRPKLLMQQFGFHKNRSSLSQLLESFDQIVEAVDYGKKVEAVYIDFSKAFDSVSHPELLNCKVVEAGHHWLTMVVLQSISLK